MMYPASQTPTIESHHLANIRETLDSVEMLLSLEFLSAPARAELMDFKQELQEKLRTALCGTVTQYPLN